MSENNQQKLIFTSEQINNFAGFYNALKTVHNRLIAEGYTIEHGQIIPPKNKLNNN
ncbi:MAG: hypothetical protein Q8O93_05245 [bacterium]|nr:hypothetical protein [bacterium]